LLAEATTDQTSLVNLQGRYKALDETLKKTKKSLQTASDELKNATLEKANAVTTAASAATRETSLLPKITELLKAIEAKDSSSGSPLVQLPRWDTLLQDDFPRALQSLSKIIPSNWDKARETDAMLEIETLQATNQSLIQQLSAVQALSPIQPNLDYALSFWQNSLRDMALQFWRESLLDLKNSSNLTYHSNTLDDLLTEVECTDIYSQSTPIKYSSYPHHLAQSVVAQLVELVSSKLDTCNQGARVAVETLCTEFTNAATQSTATNLKPTLAGHIWEYILLNSVVSQKFKCRVCKSQGTFSQPHNATQSFCDFFCHNCWHQYEIKSIPTPNSSAMRQGIKAGPYTSVLNNQLSFVMHQYKQTHTLSDGYVTYDDHYLASTASTICQSLRLFHSSLLIVSRIHSLNLEGHNVELHDINTDILTIDRRDRGAQCQGFKTIIQTTKTSHLSDCILSHPPSMNSFLTESLTATQDLLSKLQSRVFSS
jgi:hypothetical protein